MSTVGQLILSTKQKLDKTDSAAFADMLDSEIRYWLDQGADRFVKQRHEGNNYKRKAFEQSQKRVDDLRECIDTQVIVGAVAPDYRDAYQITLPDTYRYLLKVEIEVEYDDCNEVTTTEWFNPKQIEHDDLYAISKDPFNKPKYNRPRFIMEDNRMIFFLGEGVLLNARITFIELLRKLQPGYINADGTVDVYSNPLTDYTELAVDTHEELVDLAVKMILENIESQRYQTNSVEFTQTE